MNYFRKSLFTKLAAISILLTSSMAFGHGHHDDDYTPPPSSPVIVNNTTEASGNNHNVLAAAVLIGAGICIYHKCWRSKTVRDDNPNRITPDIQSKPIGVIRP